MLDEPRIAAIIVLYQEELSETKTYQTLLKTGEVPFMVYDNSLEPSSPHYPQATKVIQDPTNPGVSKAYNQAYEWARSDAFTHLLLLDSDSSFPQKAINHYKQIVRESPKQILLPEVRSEGRKISPFYFRFGKSFYGDDIDYGLISRHSIVGINSGLLIPIKAFEHIGGFNEALPLDWSDLYFLRQAKKKSVELFHFDLLIKHGLSEHEERTKAAAHFRFLCQLKAIRHLAENTREKGFIYLWLLVKSVKMSLHFKSLTFLKTYLKKIYA